MSYTIVSLTLGKTAVGTSERCFRAGLTQSSVLIWGTGLFKKREPDREPGSINSLHVRCQDELLTYLAFLKNVFLFRFGLNTLLNLSYIHHVQAALMKTIRLPKTTWSGYRSVIKSICFISHVKAHTAFNPRVWKLPGRYVRRASKRYKH